MTKQEFIEFYTSNDLIGVSKENKERIVNNFSNNFEVIIQEEVKISHKEFLKDLDSLLYLFQGADLDIIENCVKELETKYKQKL